MKPSYRRSLCRFILLVAFFFWLAGGGRALAAFRTALVIGNSGYKITPLKNPVNDARDMAAVLEALGFKVILCIDADHQTMTDKIRAFGRDLARSEIGLFYFAGHGAEVKGINYLIPVRHDIREASEIQFNAVDAGFILAKMEAAENPMNILILDACRNNPFARSFRSATRGLAKMDAPPGTIIAYATAPGGVAEDGNGRNGTYTASLISHLKQPGFHVRDVFNRTGLAVMSQTRKSQVPWISASPIPDYYLAGEVLPMPPVPVVRPADSGPAPGDIWTEPGTGMEFVRVPGGCFRMGQTHGERHYLIKAGGAQEYQKYYSDELPRHEVCLDGFWMGRYEVTNRQFRQFRPDHDSGTYKGRDLNSPDQPVVNVSWADARAFARWLGEKSGKALALPTEAQWEYAARGGTTAMRYWGESDEKACLHANVYDITGHAQLGFKWAHLHCDDGYGVTAPVGRYTANPFGLYDMLGNVYEWCRDVYDSKAYEKHGRKNPLINSGSQDRVLRGGSLSSEPGLVRLADRSGFVPSKQGVNFGFRLVF